MPDPIFSDLYRDTEHLTWSSTEQVLRRARQRTRRTRIAAGLSSAVAVAVVATGGVAVAGRTDNSPLPPPAASRTSSSGIPSPTGNPTPTGEPSPSASPSASPSTSGRPSGAGGSAVPVAALLRASDLPSGYRPAGDDLDGDWSLDAVATRCTNSPPPSTVDHQAERGVVFRADGDRTVIERVRRYTGAEAEVEVRRFVRLVTRCQPEFSLWERNFVGDQSLLVAQESEGVFTSWLVLRQGDLVAEIWLGRSTTLDGAKPLAQRAAERLCAGTNAC
ncbi:hypothetical protein [Micromonospora sp. NPDC049799]|uniref:hypothetical protein n=1 Tax=Micromonospora sp. NPDC049799 TaxID=3154741 RepID=UPI003405374A